MKKIIQTSVAGGLLVFSVTSTAGLGEYSGKAIDFVKQAEVTAALTVTTDYVFRGISQTHEDPAMQGHFQYMHDTGLFFDVWASNVDYDGATRSDGQIIDDEIFEIDYTFGFEREYFGIVWDMGYIHYDFPREDALDVNEYFFGASHEGSYGHTWLKHWVDTQTSNRYSEVNYVYTFPYDIKVGGHAGVFHETANDGDDYTDYKIWIEKSYKILNFELAYHDTDGRNVSSGQPLDDEDDRRLVFSASISLL